MSSHGTHLAERPDEQVATGSHTAPAGPSSWAQVAGIVLLLTLAVTVVLTAFAWPATRSAPRDVPLAVAGPAPAVQAVEAALAKERPGAFRIHRFADEASARAAIEDRDVYGAIVLTGGPPTVLIASAASPAVAQGLTQLAQGLAPAGGAALPAVRDVVPTPAQDPRGAGLAAGALPLVLGGIIAAGLITQRVRGGGRRLVAAISFAALGGAAVVSVLQLWLGSLTGSFWTNTGVVALAIAAISLTLIGLEWLLGPAGLGLGAAVMMLLGNPLSGLTSAPEMLPRGWGALGQLLPPGAAGSLLRSVSFFDGARGGRPLAVLACWMAAGLLLCALGAARGRRRATVR
jgi:hypothetical protein